jgi:hypothetical protein
VYRHGRSFWVVIGSGRWSHNSAARTALAARRFFRQIFRLTTHDATM